MTAHQHPTTGEAAFKCLVVEDDEAFASLVGELIRREGGTPKLCRTLAEAATAISGAVYDLVLLDNHLPDGKAYDLFGQVSRRNPDAPIVMITGLPALSEAVTLTRNGLFDYLTKPVETSDLTACIRRALLRIRHRQAEEGSECIGTSPEMRGIMNQLHQAARHPAATVLITGESGVGKDVAARALHRLTFAARAPYVALNCGAIPAEMLESELFGAERGAYTGADKRRDGLVAAAQAGTLFLDEVAEVPMPSQAKLLRFLESREFRRLGSITTDNFTGRLVAATNKDLRSEVLAGRFREDLLYRIEVFTVEIPPLRKRRDDIPQLTEYLLRSLCSKYGRPALLLKAEDLAALQGHDFPGNIRELRNVLERGLLRTPAEDPWLKLDLSPVRRATAVCRPDIPPPSPAPLACAEFSLPAERAELPVIEAQEYRLIQAALAEANGGIRRAAAKVGLSPQALLRRLEKWPELRTKPGKP